MKKQFTSLGLLLLVGLTACAQSSERNVPGDAEAVPAEQPAPAAEPVSPQTEAAPIPVAANTLEQTAANTWRHWAKTRKAAIASEKPELVSTIESLVPTRGRDGQARLNAQELSDPDAGPILLSKLLDAQRLDMRQSYAGAVAKSKGVPTEALVDLAAKAGDADVRAIVVRHLWRRDGDATVGALTNALADDALEVRVAAATAIPRHPQGTSMIEALAKVTTDDAPELRWLAARSISAIGDANDAALIEPLVSDAHPRVRRVALRAVDRLAPNRAKALIASHNLTQDPDAAVVRTAKSILAR